ncbi:hypothetical protein Tco_1561628, partial [Tanacetum coccineum]
SNIIQTIEKDEELRRKQGFTSISKEYIDIGDLIFPCESCGALLWHAKTLRKAIDVMNELYSICYGRGKIKLGTELKQPPKLLKDLITNIRNKSTSFIENIRRYNSMFAFTSMGCQVDDTVDMGRGMFCYRIHGENYHRLGALIPETARNPVRPQKIKKLDHGLTKEIRDMLDSINTLVEKFRMAAVYTIEFQKRGLPHCHILLWLEPEDKINTMGKIDQYILAEIPNKDEDPELYQIIIDHMIHGPCRADNLYCPCIVDLKCTKKFPKQFNESIVVDDNGLDRVTDAIDGEEVEEIKDFYDCRYLSACEVAWRIYGFDIHNRTPFVEWLPFHLQDEQLVIFDATESIDYKLEKASVKGPKECLEQKTYDNIVYETYRDACYACGILQVDKEYIDGLLEASEWGNGLIYDEKPYKPEELKIQHEKLYGSLTTEQKEIYSTVMDDVEKNIGRMFFVYGYGALLLKGGRGAHSRFAIPINIVKDSMCPILVDSELANLIQESN